MVITCGPTDDQWINENGARLAKRFQIARRRIFSVTRRCRLLDRIKKFDPRRHGRTIIHPFSRRRRKMHCVSFYCSLGQERGHVHTYMQFPAVLGIHFESHRVRLARQSRRWLFIVVSWRSLIFFATTRERRSLLYGLYFRTAINGRIRDSNLNMFWIRASI